MLYPWRGEFTVGSEDSQIAIDTLSLRMDFPPDDVAIWGQHKTENLGIEKIVANVVSNPNIRYLIICGEEVRGHRSGNGLISLHSNGIGDDGRIIGARGAVPYIENVPAEAISRFREQVEIIDMTGTMDTDAIMQRIGSLEKKDAYGEPFIVEFVERKKEPGMVSLTGKVSLHKDILLDPYLEIDEMPQEV